MIDMKVLERAEKFSAASMLACQLATRIASGQTISMLLMGEALMDAHKELTELAGALGMRK